MTLIILLYYSEKETSQFISTSERETISSDILMYPWIITTLLIALKYKTTKYGWMTKLSGHTKITYSRFSVKYRDKLHKINNTIREYFS